VPSNPEPSNAAPSNAGSSHRGGRLPGGEPLIQPNAEHLYRVTPADLPLACPMPGMYLWNSHPRVYLSIEQQGRAKCPYCGAVYELVPGGGS
jgi:uncharacterized Zn-finger protein